MFERLRDQQVDSYLNQSFEVRAQSHGVIELILTEAKEAKSGPATSISLIFQGPEEPVLAQATYTLHHPSLGAFTLFLVPIAGPDPTKRHYQAILSKLEEKQQIQ